MKTTNNNHLSEVLFCVGLLLVLLQAFVTNNQLDNGTLIMSMPASTGQLIYDLFYWFGYFLVGIIGAVMALFGLIFMIKSEKK